MFKEKEDLNRWFIDHSLYLDKSDKHGIGVFTNAKLPKGKVIEIAPVIISHNDAFFSDLVRGQESERHILTDYLFAWSSETVAFPLGWSGIYNHESRDPNCTWTLLRELPGLAFITKRIVEAGEEMCTRYIPAEMSGELWFIDENDEDHARELLSEKGQRLVRHAHEQADIKRRRTSKNHKRSDTLRKLNDPQTLGSLWTTKRPTIIEEE